MLFASSGVLGTLPGWLTVIGVIVVAWLFYRGGSPTAVTGLQDVNRELERQIKEGNHELERQIKERDGKISALERVNAELRAEKDVTVAILPVIEAMKAHEDRAQERHAGMLKVLDLIAERLGPEPNGTG